MMRVLAVCTGTAQPVAAKSGRTGHFKTPQMGAVEVSTLGLAQDTIVDTDHHGGPEQAVYVFTEDDRIWWENTLGTPLPAGYFGENLLVDGLSSADLGLGDTLDIGPVTLQITAPRIPCSTFIARTGRADAVQLFFASARPGAYARVLRRGAISAFDQVTHTPFDGPRITIPENLGAWKAKFPDLDLLRRALEIPAHEGLHAIARKRLANCDAHPILD